jgi:hypothetical protein
LAHDLAGSARSQVFVSRAAGAEHVPALAAVELAERALREEHAL